MRIVHTPVYSYSELSEAAKSAARQWWREAIAGDNYFSESVISDAVECAAILGIEIEEKRVYWSGFSSQGSGASFEGAYRYAKGAARLIRAHAPTDTVLHGIADRLQRAQVPYFYGLSASVSQSGRYSHSHTMRVSVDHDSRAVSDDTDEEITDCMRDFADWIYRMLEAEYEYAYSDECVAENIEANEYEFTIEGGRA